MHHAADLDDVAVAIVVQDLLRLRQGDLGRAGSGEMGGGSSSVTATI